MRCCAPHGKITARPKFGVDIRKKMVYDTKANKEERSVLTCAFRTKQVNTILPLWENCVLSSVNVSSFTLLIFFEE